MINVGFELPNFEQRTDRRRVWGWFLLLGIFALLIAGTLNKYFTKDPNDSLLRSIAFKNQLLDSAQLPGSDFDKERVAEAIAKLRARNDETSAVYVVAFESELNQPLDGNALRRLRGSSDPANRAVARAVSAGALPPDQARRLATTLRQVDRFVYDLLAMRTLEKAGLRKAEEPLAPDAKEAKLLRVTAVFALLLGSGFCLLMVYLAMRLSGKLRPLGNPSDRLSPADADRYALRAAHHLLVYMFLPFLLLPVLSWIGEAWLAPFVMIAPVAAVVLLSLVPVGGKKITLGRMGITSENFAANVGWGVAGAIANFPIILLVAFVSLPMFRGLPPPEHPVQFELEGSPGTSAVALIFILVAVLAPIWEEITFRGLMLPAFASIAKSPAFGVFASSFLFASIHPQGIPGWPMLATIGAMSCLLTYQTRSLVPSIVMHAVHNSLILLVTLTVT